MKSDLGVHGLPGDVSPWDIRFDPTDRAFLDRAPDDRYRVRVWAEPGLTDGVVVARRSGEYLGFRLQAIAMTERYVYWESVLALEPGDEISLAFRNPVGAGVYRVPGGITNAVERLDRWRVPDLRPLEIPTWSQGAVIYQIFPDRFANGDPTNDPIETGPWGSPPRPDRFQGGDLIGITEHLDHVAGLGADLLYLTPIFTSPSNHRYDTVDYLHVDPVLGGDEALVVLLQKAREQNIRLILDASFNHCHPGFFAFRDLIEHGPDSEYRNWFTVQEWPVRIKIRKSAKRQQRKRLDLLAAQTGLNIEEVDEPGPAVEPTYECWYGVPSMPRVNVADRDARQYMLGIAAEWLRAYGTHGWRMDVARYVDPDFWVDFRKVVKDSNPDAYLLGEFMGDASRWLQGDMFDATMNYTFRDICVRFLALREVDAVEATDDLARLWAQYPWAVTLANQNLIGSHDTPRFLTLADGDLKRLRLATVLSLTFPGAPGIYYGDEVGLEGGDDPGSRGAFPWESDPKTHPMYQTIAALTALRRKYPALVKGEWRPSPARGGLLAFERVLKGQRLAVVINRGKRRRIELPRSGKLLWGEAELDKRKLTVAAHEAAIVKLGR